MPFDFDTVIDRRNTGSLKWDRYAGKDILPLWVADMDFTAPPCVLDAIRHRLDHGILGYSAAHPGIADTALEYLGRQHGVQAEADWIHWLPGLVPAKSMACRAAGGKGDAVMIQTPVYPPFFFVHKDAEMDLIRVPLGRNEATNGNWAMDFDALEAAVTPQTKVFLFCNPHNPVGRAWSRENVEKIADFCLRHGLLFVSDEIHCDLVLEPEKTPHFSAARLEGPIRKQLIVLMAASKTYNLPGMSLAWAIIPDDSLRRRFKAGGGKLIPELNPLSYHATQSALRDGEPWRQELLAYLRGNRDFLRDYLAQHLPAIKMAQPMEATYLAWLDPRELGIERPYAFFEQGGVGLSDGTDFGAPGFLRLNLGCPRATLQEALDRMKKAVESR